MIVASNQVTYFYPDRRPWTNTKKVESEAATKDTSHRQVSSFTDGYETLFDLSDPPLNPSHSLSYWTDALPPSRRLSSATREASHPSRPTERRRDLLPRSSSRFSRVHVSADASPVALSSPQGRSPARPTEKKLISSGHSSYSPARFFIQSLDIRFASRGLWGPWRSLNMKRWSRIMFAWLLQPFCCIVYFSGKPWWKNEELGRRLINQVIVPQMSEVFVENPTIKI